MKNKQSRKHEKSNVRRYFLFKQSDNWSEDYVREQKQQTSG